MQTFVPKIGQTYNIAPLTEQRDERGRVLALAPRTGKLVAYYETTEELEFVDANGSYIVIDASEASDLVHVA